MIVSAQVCAPAKTRSITGGRLRETVTVMAASRGAEPSAVPFTTSAYLPSGSVEDAAMVNVELSGTLVLSTEASRPVGAIAVYVMAVVNPRARVVLMNVLTEVPAATSATGVPSVTANVGSFVGYVAASLVPQA